MISSLTPRQPNWLPGMEDWMMRESQRIKGWMAEGAGIAEVRLMRAVLLKAIGAQLACIAHRFWLICRNCLPESKFSY